ncbi:hypothetical protein T4B_7214 [Trichinella pseudospiralis]|uniref:Uncharacterized protein n=2 Tax=Trichinella pseudospiralis TaxID=6337 RepID=A0A0V1IKJ7_TRIPS|nr:hypothetical protein T4B_7214 [Trichinella pseudospiralis]
MPEELRKIFAFHSPVEMMIVLMEIVDEESCSNHHIWLLSFIGQVINILNAADILLCKDQQGAIFRLICPCCMRMVKAVSHQILLFVIGFVHGGGVQEFL